jgi:hypothetical protein
MEAYGAPCRVIAPGRVYRADYDQTHTPMFHQVEGLAIDRDISMANLKWTLEEFFSAYFGTKVRTRFRASHFPFTEPSAEVDIQCSWEGGTVKVGEGDDWLEVLGSGMVHPKVLEAGKVDPDEWQGFAFGMGIDRIGMLKYGIPDLRAFFEDVLVPDLEALSELFPGHIGRSATSVTGRIIGAGDTVEVFAFQAPRSEDDDAVEMMYDLASNYSVDVCYCSVLDECWIAHTSGSANPKPESVDACPASGVSQL